MELEVYIAEMIEQYVTAYNDFDIDGMLDVLADGIRFENYSGGALTAEATGKEAFRALAEEGKSLFVEREQRITLITVKEAEPRQRSPIEAGSLLTFRETKRWRNS